jgi:hypothetical protein
MHKRKAITETKQTITVSDSDSDFESTEQVSVASATSSSTIELITIEQKLSNFVTNQSAVDLINVQPRNKARGASIGSVYNAHRIRLLSNSQIMHLVNKVKYERKEDGCWISTGTEKKQATVANPSATKRPRGCQLDSRFKGEFGDTTFEQVQIMLAQAGKFPPTSEHEVSHLCHTVSCVNPEHLLWELHTDNVAREKCRFTRAVTCPCGCNHTFTLCSHSPSCVVCTCNHQ